MACSARHCITNTDLRCRVRAQNNPVFEGKRGLLEEEHPQISQRREAALLAVTRSSAAYQPVPARSADA